MLPCIILWRCVVACQISLQSLLFQLGFSCHPKLAEGFCYLQSINACWKILRQAQDDNYLIPVIIHVHIIIRFEVEQAAEHI